jgi:ElaA protein
MSLTIRQAKYGSEDFQKCFDIRMAVFVHEQNVPPEDERDEFDATGIHFLAELNGEPAGTARLLLKDGYAKITRVAVLRSARGLHIGQALMRHAEAASPLPHFVLTAQTQALKFYEQLGYEQEGEEFLEAGIPHFQMRKGK